MPKNVWFSHDSAYPKQNMFERQVQLISCAGDKNVLIWSLRKPSSDDDDDEMMDEQMHEQQSKEETRGQWPYRVASDRAIKMAKYLKPAT